MDGQLLARPRERTGGDASGARHPERRGNRYAATTIVAAVTSTIRIYPVTVPLRKGEGGLRRSSMVNLAQVLTVDRARLERRVGALSAERIALVNAAIQVSLGVT